MKIKHYSVLDTAAQAFLNLIAFPTDSAAIRWFDHQVNQGDKQTSNFAAYPQQFILYRIGEMDDKTGHFETLDTPIELITGTAVQEEAAKAFTVRELITALESHFRSNNIIDFPSTKEEQQ